MIPTQLPYFPPELQQFQPVPFAINSAAGAAADAFWQIDHVKDHVKSLQDNINLLRAMQKELEILLHERSRESNDEGSAISCEKQPVEELLSLNSSISDDEISQFIETVKKKNISLSVQEFHSLEAANSLMLILKNQLAPLSAFANELSPWEQRSAAVWLFQKLQKHRRNKRWKRKKRRRIAELLRKDRENFDKADKEVDEWRAREVAKDMAKQKVENMKAIAKVKANEEKRRLEAEHELVQVVEKLHELRSIRIQKLKKQGHFFPEEDDKFLERVRAAVEDEERQTAAAAETDAAKDAIATAEESRKAIHDSSKEAKDNTQCKVLPVNILDGKKSEIGSSNASDLKPAQPEVAVQSSGRSYDSVSSLPFEFYHYYHGSSHDLGTLVEVRRMWDAYIRPGGSRIPGHWVQPPPPADEVWASYLVQKQ